MLWVLKEPSEWDGSFERPKYMLKQMGKKTIKFFFFISKPMNSITDKPYK